MTTIISEIEIEGNKISELTSVSDETRKLLNEMEQKYFESKNKFIMKINICIGISTAVPLALQMSNLESNYRQNA